MHSINIRRVSAGVLLGVTCMTTVTTMPSSTGKLSTETLVQRNTEALVSDGNRFQFPKSIIGNNCNSSLELESVSWCADCGI